MFKFLKRLFRKRYTPAEARRLWTQALESGQYPQVTGTNCKRKDGQPIGYCCLGVACEVYQRHVGDLDVAVTDSYTYYDDAVGHLPARVRDWLSLRTDMGYYTTPDGQASLVSLNDHLNKSFAEIAEVIKSEPTGLFV